MEELIRALRRLLIPIYGLTGLLVILVTGVLAVQHFPDVGPELRNPGRVEEELIVETGNGLVEGEGKQLVISNCTTCHSAKLVTQNRASREGWISMIRWMQETQNLWDLGKEEEAILDYLSKHYAPEGKGRRANLTGVEWYELE